MNETRSVALVLGVVVCLATASHAQVLRQLTDVASGNYSSYAIDDAGDVVFQGTGNAERVAGAGLCTP
jgi:hypothetical protein